MISHADSAERAKDSPVESVRLGLIHPDTLDAYAQALEKYATDFRALADSVRTCEEIGAGPVIVDGRTKFDQATALLKKFMLNGNFAVMKAKARLE